MLFFVFNADRFINAVRFKKEVTGADLSASAGWRTDNVKGHKNMKGNVKTDFINAIRSNEIDPEETSRGPSFNAVRSNDADRFGAAADLSACAAPANVKQEKMIKK